MTASQAAQTTAPLKVTELVRALTAACTGRPGLVASISHDDYGRLFGGVQNVVGDEQAAFERIGWAYLHISPAAPSAALADWIPTETCRLGLRLNRQWLGIAEFPDLVGSLAAASSRGLKLRCVVHHLMGHVPEQIQALVQAAGTEQSIVWVHDFFTLCESYALMRNDEAFCGAPPSDSAACATCSYGAGRKRHLARMAAFLDAVQPFVLAPSRHALDFWIERSARPDTDGHVVPHARLLLAHSRTFATPDPVGQPLRIAHLGSCVAHKGWFVFEQLARRFATDGRFAFFHLGTAPGRLPENVMQIDVAVTPDHRAAMIEAAAQTRIDVALVWPLCSETFSFVTHEALAAGAFVLARSGAGNVGPAIAANAAEQGVTVDNEAELFALFEDGRLQSLVAASRRRRGVLLEGGGSADWLRRQSCGQAA